MGSPAPIDCPAGTFSLASMAVSERDCIDCDAGFQCVKGIRIPCTAGTYASAPQSAACRTCEPGTFQSEQGETACRTCANRTYASRHGAVECNNCLFRLSSLQGSASCDVCDEGFFRRDAQGAVTPSTCEPCFDKGAECPWNTTLETIVVLPGFWRLSNRSMEMTKCDGSAVEQRCLGGKDAGVDGEGYCGNLYTSPECQLCRDKGFYRRRNECVQCPKMGGRLAALTGIAVCMAVAAAALHLALFHRLGIRVTALQPIRRMIARLQSRAMGIGSLCKLKILFSFYSIAKVLDTVYEAMMPHWYTDTIDASFGWAEPGDWLSSLLLPSECMTFDSTRSSFRSRLLLKALIPPVIVLFTTLGSIVAKCVKLGWGRQGLLAGVFGVIPFALVISFVCVPSVSMSIFQSFLCVEYQLDGSNAENITTYSYLAALVQATSHQNLCQCFVGWCPFW